MQRERSRLLWRRLKGAMAVQRGQSVQSVQVTDAKGVSWEFTDQSGIEEADRENIHHKCFYLAEDAPICQLPLRGDFGYCAQSWAGREVLSGSYWYGDRTYPATQDLLEEVTRLRQLIPANSVSDIISGKEWSDYWKKAREETLSSESGLLFGHQIALADSPLLLHLQATRCSVALRCGFGF
jgi:hypothetical protein